MESRKDRFRRLANIRVNNAIKQLELIGNLSNKSSYEFEDDDIRKIFSELDSVMKHEKQKFKLGSKKRFTL